MRQCLRRAPVREPIHARNTRAVAATARSRPRRQSRRERVVGNGRVVVFLAGLVGRLLRPVHALAAPRLAVPFAAAFVAPSVHPRIGDPGLAPRHAGRGVLRRAPAAPRRRLARQGPAGARNTWTRSTPTPPTSTCSAPGRCSSCSAPPARAPARTRWPAGCAAPRPPPRSAPARRPWPSCATSSTCARSWPCSAATCPSASISSAVAAWGRAPVMLAARGRAVGAGAGVATLVCLGGWGYRAVRPCPLPTSRRASGTASAALPLAVMLVLEAAFAGLFVRRVQRVLASVEKRRPRPGHALGRAGLPGKGDLPRPAAGRAAPRPGRERPHRRAAVAAHRRAGQPDRPAQLAAQPVLRPLRLPVALGHADGLRHRALARRGPGRRSAAGWTSSASSRRCAPWPRTPTTTPKIRSPRSSTPGRATTARGWAIRCCPAGRASATTSAWASRCACLIVSGSNMSGKSTFLRTIGVNAVLALAGAPVRARRMRLSPLALGATLRIQDSLQAGRSRFYAEILRVRQVVDLSRGADAAAVPARRNLRRHQLARPPHRGRGRGAAGWSRPGRSAW